MAAPPATMHAKSDSEVTSYDQSTPPRSPRRPLYYVQSPSNHDVEKMSYGSSPLGSPRHHNYYHCSPIHHSRESSTSRFSASLKNPRGLSAWKKIQRGQESDVDDDDDDGDGVVSGGSARNVRLYFCFALLFVVLFTLFSLILWGASKSYKPQVVVEHIVFRRFNIQAGNDRTGVPTDMLSLNSTVRMLYKNPGTFFGVHVTSTPLELHYYELKVASGQMKKFYQRRKSHRKVVTVVLGNQVPLYGGLSVVGGARDNIEKVVVPLKLSFKLRSRAYILGQLVKSKFYTKIQCSVTLRGSKLGKPLNLTNSCTCKS
ncbi:Late embryogenesis abundant protein [Trema orientale]|uniref:Late embryogenesis abundant protein n=1 Tax=Trema orientale TaxID=63057 RepID=A0A2P5CKF1_TREOI|nr:Late embryogenesis abundant protein [Trema orientale]